MSLPHFVDATAAKRGLGRRLFVDIDALAANWKLLQSRVQPAECSAVVKANAFGVGAKPVVRRLMLAGCQTFFIADVEEALEIRQVGDGARIFTLNGYDSFHADLYLRSKIIPVLNSLDEIADYARLCRSAGRKLPAALQVYTGLNRLGLPKSDVERARTIILESIQELAPIPRCNSSRRRPTARRVRERHCTDRAEAVRAPRCDPWHAQSVTCAYSKRGMARRASLVASGSTILSLSRTNRSAGIATSCRPSPRNPPAPTMA
jgi:hypothetical protein